MSTTAETSNARLRRAHLSFGGLVRSEWIKLRSLRSTFWCYLIVFLLTLGLAALTAAVIPKDAVSGAGAPGAAPAPDPTHTWLMVSTLGVTFAQLVVAVLGALVITGEYGTGMIRSTFAAVPQRLPAVGAKALVLAIVTFVVTFVSLALSALLTAPILSGRGITPDLGDSDVWLALLGAAGYLTLLAVLSLAIGLIIRNSAGAIATALGLILVLPIVFGLLGALIQAAWLENVANFLPSSAGGRMYADHPVASVTNGLVTLDGWQGLITLVVWCVVAGVIGGILVKRRDA